MIDPRCRPKTATGPRARGPTAAQRARRPMSLRQYRPPLSVSSPLSASAPLAPPLCPSLPPLLPLSHSLCLSVSPVDPCIVLPRRPLAHLSGSGRGKGALR